MNVERMSQLIAHLSNVKDDNFDMGDWINMEDDVSAFDILARPIEFKVDIKDFLENPGRICGTAGCIAGHALLLSIADNEDVTAFTSNVSQASQEWLGINNSTKYHLFTPGNYVNYDHVTREDAILVLMNLIETGYVDWWKVAPHVISSSGHLTEERAYVEAYLKGPREFPT